MDELVTWLRQQIQWTRSTANDAATDWASGPDGDEMALEVSSILVGAHLVLNDPRAMLAQCESHTAILDLWHGTKTAVEAADGTVLASAARVRLGAYDRAVKALGLAYQHRPGYREEWKP